MVWNGRQEEICLNQKHPATCSCCLIDWVKILCLNRCKIDHFGYALPSQSLSWYWRCCSRCYGDCCYGNNGESLTRQVRKESTAVSCWCRWSCHGNERPWQRASGRRRWPWRHRGDEWCHLVCCLLNRHSISQYMLLFTGYTNTLHTQNYLVLMKIIRIL